MTPAQSRLIRVDDEERELCQVCGFEVESCYCEGEMLVNEFEPGDVGEA